MFSQSTSILLAGLALFSAVASGQSNDTMAQKVGWSGKLSSLDGGLGGTITVVDASTLMISDYTLKDASAPALYWWGTTGNTIKDGFRISNEQVTHAATSNSLTIKLDAGKTPADFATVGLWCERLSANFGQATLKPSSGSGSGSASGGSGSGAANSAASAMKGSFSRVVVVTVGAVFVAYWMV
ncbi:domon domain-containing protein [Colletotrichum karsti]|uniref:Domon domain-containing protein n=1 Tax=Colletotrichum karsti TaxID=1095194 RepID=A0A9P6LFT6_9PEZI|nr:domon domain-containing protein [Colletotrichum karsti]KAF9870915.1 domon domain-containing protein [Colletotrichum karsti]